MDDIAMDMLRTEITMCNAKARCRHYRHREAEGLRIGARIRNFGLNLLLTAADRPD